MKKLSEFKKGKFSHRKKKLKEDLLDFIWGGLN